MDYGKALDLQRALAKARMERRVSDILILLEHHHVITLGRGADQGHLVADEATLRERGVKVYNVERGGDITYHGPGQLVGYPIMDLTQYGSDLHLYIRNLEEVLIQALKDLGIEAGRRAGLIGIWAGGGKIASIGVHVKRWVTWHGFALNVNTDLSYFDLTIPCGLSGIRVTSIASILGREVPMGEVMDKVVSRFSWIFQVNVKEGRLP